MAKTKTKIKGLQYPKPKASFFLCCFGSLPHKTPTGSTITKPEHNPKQKILSSWFPWKRIPLRVKHTTTTTKTVPLEGSKSDEKEKLKLKAKGSVKKVHSSKWKSKSNLHNKTQTNPPPPSQTPPVLPVTPNQTPPHSQQNRENNNVVEGDMCQQSSPSTRAAPAMSHVVSLPTAKGQVRRLLSSMQPQTTSKQPKQLQNAERYNPVVGTSVVMVTLVIMILWGRLCAILCTSAWLYLIPRFRMTGGTDEDNSNDNSKDLNLDSEVYKKKVILEGLVTRNNRGML